VSLLLLQAEVWVVVVVEVKLALALGGLVTVVVVVPQSSSSGEMVRRQTKAGRPFAAFRGPASSGPSGEEHTIKSRLRSKLNL
jgi:hypothetical protein